MNGIYGMALVYESLIPVNNVEDTFLSVGTVTMQDSEGELNLDFNETCSSCERAKDGIVTFTTSPIPLTLKSAQLLFQDGRFLDYSERISVFALKELAEAA